MKTYRYVLATLAVLLLGGIFYILAANRHDRIAEENAIAQAAQNQATAEKGQALLEQITANESSGRITHAQAQQYRDMLSGKIPLYKTGEPATNDVGQNKQP